MLQSICQGNVWIEALVMIFEVFYERAPIASVSVSLFYDLVTCGVGLYDKA